MTLNLFTSHNDPWKLETVTILFAPKKQDTREQQCLMVHKIGNSSQISTITTMYFLLKFWAPTYAQTSSQKKHQVIILELTCPAEEGMSAAKTLKEAKYLPLITDIINTNQWKVSFFTIEVGVRGFVNNSFWKCFLSLGLSRQQATKLCKKVSLVSAKCSYFISANSPSWEENKSLLTVEDA